MYTDRRLPEEIGSDPERSIRATSVASSTVTRPLEDEIPSVASETMNVGAWNARAMTALNMLQSTATTIAASMATSSG